MASGNTRSPSAGRSTSGRNGSGGCDGETDPIVLVGALSGRGRTPTDFASAAPLRPTKGGTPYDLQGHVIDAHGTRTVYMRLGPESQRVGAKFRVTSVTSPLLSMEMLARQGYQFEEGPDRPRAKRSKEIAA